MLGRADRPGSLPRAAARPSGVDSTSGASVGFSVKWKESLDLSATENEVVAGAGRRQEKRWCAPCLRGTWLSPALQGPPSPSYQPPGTTAAACT